MSHAEPYLNSLGQPIGASLKDWAPPIHPPRTPMTGDFCRVEPLDVKAHSLGLFKAFQEDRDDRLWTYLPNGPFKDFLAFRQWMEATCLAEDPLFYTIIDTATEDPLGMASYLRIAPTVGVIEVGHIVYAPRLQRTTAATEAMFLMMHRVFAELGYRRYEWKCDALNAPSRHSARRLGFCFEGVFRQATLYKHRNRDTAWFSIIDTEWPALERAYRQWFAEVRQSKQRAQSRSLTDFINEERGKKEGRKREERGKWGGWDQSGKFQDKMSLNSVTDPFI